MRLGLGPNLAILFQSPARFWPAAECQAAVVAVESEAAEHGITDMVAARTVLLEEEAAEKNGVQLSLRVSQHWQL